MARKARELPTTAPVPEPLVLVRPVDKPEAHTWVVFGDLHVKAQTLSRALEVLRIVGETAVKYQATIVCVGDFWDQRGTLAVRQVDAVLTAVEVWKSLGLKVIFIPGNHDHVTLDGTIHGVRIFSPFPNVEVATNPIFKPELGVAFLPWREELLAQEQLFQSIGKGWTVFGHAEVAGAVANNGRKSPGKVSLATVDQSRAVFLGHYHRRQKLGKNTYYIGSPFQMDFGERDQLHGIAIIKTGPKGELSFLDLDQFPKHFVVGLGQVPPFVRQQDIVRVTAPREELGSPALIAFMGKLGAADVSAVPAAVVGNTEQPPTFALSLVEAVGEYVNHEGTVHPLPIPADDLKALGLTLLGEVPEKSLPKRATEVTPLSVTVSGFCAINETVYFPFAKGRTLIRGRQASGKTALADAITWGLYDRTSPRKAGAHGATFKADEVVNDDAQEAVVKSEWKVGKDVFRIIRSKRRGTGSRVRIEGPDVEHQGISDQQQLIEHIIGLDLDLWRACVSLGQGAVANFVTDTDKARKEMLSKPFGLDTCTAARKIASDKRKLFSMQLDKLRVDVLSDQKVIQVIAERDFTKQLAEWDVRHASEEALLQQQHTEATASIAQCDEHLKGEGQWLTTKQNYEKHLDGLVKSVTQSSTKVATLQRDWGAAQAEKALLERELATTKMHLQQLVEQIRATGHLPCPTCGKPFDTQARDQHADSIEKKIGSLVEQIRSFDTKLSNIAVELDKENSTGKRPDVEVAINETREQLAKCVTALSQFARLKEHKSAAERRLTEARTAIEKWRAAVNPFTAEKERQERELQTARTRLASNEARLTELRREDEGLAFWAEGFGPKGLPVLVLRTVLYELETHANRYLSHLLQGQVLCKLIMDGDDLSILWLERDKKTHELHERRYEQLSGGQRRCCELAFQPFALGDLIFGRCGVRVSAIIVDELCIHMGAEEKALACQMVRELDRETGLVIDHDVAVMGEFDQVVEMKEGAIVGGAP